MASQMVVAPSKDTLFVRGFSSRRDVEDVRDYFEKEARSKVMIEFLKQTELDERLFVALRFESKEVAKDILNRFDNTEVLGDKIALTWFKDLRRARSNRAYGNNRDTRYPQGRHYNNYDNYNYGRYDRNNRDNRNRIDRNRRRSSHRYDRSHSRSVSHSRSRSRSREHESRDRDRRDDGRDSRSMSPAPSSKHKLKSAVTTASKDKMDDSDNERSSPLKESSVSPDRRYDSDPPSEGEDRDYSPAPRESSKTKNTPQDSKSRNKDSQDADYQDDESFEERYPDDKYSREESSSRQTRPSSKKTTGAESDGRRQESAERSRYSADYDSKELWENGAQSRRNAGPPFYDQYGNKQDPDWMAGVGGTGSGWSPQAMQLIQDKKEDIEKVYKNDCETFVSVVKMLINKDPMLESSLQHSLRENLKEIGQRCILELREYIDRMREKEDTNVSAPMGV